MAKIHKFQGDITKEVANSLKESIAIDTEATGLQIPERDKLSLIQICDQNGLVYIIQPDRQSYKAPNLVSVLENEKILKIGLNVVLLTSDVLVNGIKNKITNAPPIATTPPNLSGIDLKIA